MSHVVKRRGHRQEFDERKVYASVYAACLNTHMPKEESEHIAQDVSSEIKKWIKDKPEVNSSQIFTEVGKELARFSKEASFMYHTHRDLS